LSFSFSASNSCNRKTTEPTPLRIFMASPFEMLEPPSRFPVCRERAPPREPGGSFG
jgi:hypothetical protein